MPSSAGGPSRARGASTNSAATAAAAANTPPIPISITICGDGGCGKSSITLRLVRSAWTSEYDPTIEDSYSVTRRIDGATYHLALTDTAGQEEYRGMWASSNLGADAFLMVYDITSSASLDALGYFNDLIDMEVDTRLDNAARARKAGGVVAPGASVPSETVPPIKFVAGNKCDLSQSRQVSAATGLDWARKRGCGFMETSARLEVNIEETFALIVRRVVEARRVAEMGDGRGAGNNNNKSKNNNNGAGGGGVAPAVVVGGGQNATAPLSPLPDGEGEKGDGKDRRGGGAFWSRLRCW